MLVVVGSRRGSTSDLDSIVFPRLATAGGNEGTRGLIELEVGLQIGNGRDQESLNRRLRAHSNIAKQTDFTCCEFNFVKQWSCSSPEINPYTN